MLEAIGLRFVRGGRSDHTLYARGDEIVIVAGSPRASKKLSICSSRRFETRVFQFQHPSIALRLRKRAMLLFALAGMNALFRWIERRPTFWAPMT